MVNHYLSRPAMMRVLSHEEREKEDEGGTSHKIRKRREGEGHGGWRQRQDGTAEAQGHLRLVGEFCLSTIVPNFSFSLSSSGFCNALTCHRYSETILVPPLCLHFNKYVCLWH